MVNYKLQGDLIKLATHTAVGTEATITLTPSQSSLLFSKLILVFHGSTTAALALHLEVNGISTTNVYFTDGRSFSGGTETIIDDTGDFSILAPSAILAAADYNFNGTVDLYLSLGGANDYIAGDCKLTFATQAGNSQTSFHCQSAVTSITSVRIFTSTSTWKAGAVFSLYGVRK